jgi:hypothetical protein
MTTDQPGTSQARQCCFCVGAEALTEMFRNVWSDKTQDHFRSSRIEFLNGIRSLIDDRIDRLSRNERKGTTVTVE